MKQIYKVEIFDKFEEQGFPRYFTSLVKATKYINSKEFKEYMITNELFVKIRGIKVW